MKNLDKARMNRPDASLIVDEMQFTADLTCHSCKQIISRAGGQGVVEGAVVPAGDARALAAELEALMADYRRLWMARSRPGGFAESIGRFQALLDSYRAC